LCFGVRNVVLCRTFFSCSTRQNLVLKQDKTASRKYPAYRNEKLHDHTAHGSINGRFWAVFSARL
jgi:hypothetical protein